MQAVRSRIDAIREWIQRKQRLRQAYRDCFCGRDGKPHPAGQTALADLRRFSGVNNSGLVRDAQGRADPVAMAYAKGLQDCYQRVVFHLNIDDADLYKYDAAERQQRAASNE